jgi:hypothetical protein
VKFFLKHPYPAGIFAFLLVTIGGSALGIIAGVLIVMNDTTQPLSSSDPHDGAAMASVMILSLAIMVSLTLGILAGLITTYILQSKQRRKSIE